MFVTNNYCWIIGIVGVVFLIEIFWIVGFIVSSVGVDCNSVVNRVWLYIKLINCSS